MFNQVCVCVRFCDHVAESQGMYAEIPILLMAVSKMTVGSGVVHTNKEVQKWFPVMLIRKMSKFQRGINA